MRLLTNVRGNRENQPLQFLTFQMTEQYTQLLHTMIPHVPYIRQTRWPKSRVRSLAIHFDSKWYLFLQRKSSQNERNGKVNKNTMSLLNVLCFSFFSITVSFKQTKIDWTSNLFRLYLEKQWNWRFYLNRWIICYRSWFNRGVIKKNRISC